MTTLYGMDRYMEIYLIGQHRAHCQMQVIAPVVANDTNEENMLQMLSQLEPLISIGLHPMQCL